MSNKNDDDDDDDDDDDISGMGNSTCTGGFFLSQGLVNTCLSGCLFFNSPFLNSLYN